MSQCTESNSVDLEHERGEENDADNLHIVRIDGLDDSGKHQRRCQEVDHEIGDVSRRFHAHDVLFGKIVAHGGVGQDFHQRFQCNVDCSSD